MSNLFFSFEVTPSLRAEKPLPEKALLPTGTATHANTFDALLQEQMKEGQTDSLNESGSAGFGEKPAEELHEPDASNSKALTQTEGPENAPRSSPATKQPAPSLKNSAPEPVEAYHTAPLPSLQMHNYSDTSNEPAVQANDAAPLVEQSLESRTPAPARSNGQFDRSLPNEAMDAAFDVPQNWQPNTQLNNQFDTRLTTIRDLVGQLPDDVPHNLTNAPRETVAVSGLDEPAEVQLVQPFGTPNLPSPAIEQTNIVAAQAPTADTLRKAPDFQANPNTQSSVQPMPASQESLPASGLVAPHNLVPPQADNRLATNADWAEPIQTLVTNQQQVSPHPSPQVLAQPNATTGVVSNTELLAAPLLSMQPVANATSASGTGETENQQVETRQATLLTTPQTELPASPVIHTETTVAENSVLVEPVQPLVGNSPNQEATDNANLRFRAAPAHAPLVEFAEQQAAPITTAKTTVPVGTPVQFNRAAPEPTAGLNNNPAHLFSEQPARHVNNDGEELGLATDNEATDLPNADTNPLLVNIPLPLNPLVAPPTPEPPPATTKAEAGQIKPATDLPQLQPAESAPAASRFSLAQLHATAHHFSQPLPPLETTWTSPQPLVTDSGAATTAAPVTHAAHADVATSTVSPAPVAVISNPLLPIETTLTTPPSPVLDSGVATTAVPVTQGTQANAITDRDRQPPVAVTPNVAQPETAATLASLASEASSAFRQAEAPLPTTTAADHASASAKTLPQPPQHSTTDKPLAIHTAPTAAMPANAASKEPAVETGATARNSELQPQIDLATHTPVIAPATDGKIKLALNNVEQPAVSAEHHDLVVNAEPLPTPLLAAEPAGGPRVKPDAKPAEKFQPALLAKSDFITTVQTAFGQLAAAVERNGPSEGPPAAPVFIQFTPANTTAKPLATAEIPTTLRQSLPHVFAALAQPVAAPVANAEVAAALRVEPAQLDKLSASPVPNAVNAAQPLAAEHAGTHTSVEPGTLPAEQPRQVQNVGQPLLALGVEPAQMDKLPTNPVRNTATAAQPLETEPAVTFTSVEPVTQTAEQPRLATQPALPDAPPSAPDTNTTTTAVNPTEPPVAQFESSPARPVLSAPVSPNTQTSNPAVFNQPDLPEAPRAVINNLASAQSDTTSPIQRPSVLPTAPTSSEGIANPPLAPSADKPAPLDAAFSAVSSDNFTSPVEAAADTLMADVSPAASEQPVRIVAARTSLAEPLQTPVLQPAESALDDRTQPSHWPSDSANSSTPQNARAEVTVEADTPHLFSHEAPTKPPAVAETATGSGIKQERIVVTESFTTTSPIQAETAQPTMAAATQPVAESFTSTLPRQTEIAQPTAATATPPVENGLMLAGAAPSRAQADPALPLAVAAPDVQAVSSNNAAQLTAVNQPFAQAKTSDLPTNPELHVSEPVPVEKAAQPQPAQTKQPAKLAIEEVGEAGQSTPSAQKGLLHESKPVAAKPANEHAAQPAFAAFTTQPELPSKPLTVGQVVRTVLKDNYPLVRPDAPKTTPPYATPPQPELVVPQTTPVTTESTIPQAQPTADAMPVPQSSPVTSANLTPPLALTATTATTELNAAAAKLSATTGLKPQTAAVPSTAAVQPPAKPVVAASAPSLPSRTLADMPSQPVPAPLKSVPPALPETVSTALRSAMQAETVTKTVEQPAAWRAVDEGFEAPPRSSSTTVSPERASTAGQRTFQLVLQPQSATPPQTQRVFANELPNTLANAPQLQRTATTSLPSQAAPLSAWPNLEPALLTEPNATVAQVQTWPVSVPDAIVEAVQTTQVLTPLDHCEAAPLAPNLISEPLRPSLAAIAQHLANAAQPTARNLEITARPMPTPSVNGAQTAVASQTLDLHQAETARELRLPQSFKTDLAKTDLAKTDLAEPFAVQAAPLTFERATPDAVTADLTDEWLGQRQIPDRQVSVTNVAGVGTLTQMAAVEAQNATQAVEPAHTAAVTPTYFSTNVTTNLWVTNNIANNAPANWAVPKPATQSGGTARWAAAINKVAGQVTEQLARQVTEQVARVAVTEEVPLVVTSTTVPSHSTPLVEAPLPANPSVQTADLPANQPVFTPLASANTEPLPTQLTQPTQHAALSGTDVTGTAPLSVAPRASVLAREALRQERAIEREAQSAPQPERVSMLGTPPAWSQVQIPAQPSVRHAGVELNAEASPDSVREVADAAPANATGAGTPLPIERGTGVAQSAGARDVSEGHVARQLAEPLITASAELTPNEPRTIRLKLRPKEMGQVEIELRCDAAGRFNARLTVEREQTTHVLRSELGQLREALEQAGLQVGQLDITTSTSQHGQGWHASGQDAQHAHTPLARIPEPDSFDFEPTQPGGAATAHDRLINLHA